MSRLYFFNPENDINLSYGHDTPRLSPLVRALRRDGSLLPIWYADSNNYLLASDVDIAWLNDITRDFNISSTLFSGQPITDISPWGWSIQTARYLRSLGLVTPDDQHINRIRDISHRRASIYIAEHLNLPIEDIPVEAKTISDIQHFIDTYGDAYIKAPWSSSGRGVIHTSTIGRNQVSIITSTLKRQGSLLLERAHNDAIQDFAMLFYAENGIVMHKGYSLFSTDHTGAYSGNLVSSDTEILRRLTHAGANPDKITQLAEQLMPILSDYIGRNYCGWLGIDMLLCAGGKIVPCIELNLRMTMGVVAWFFAKRWLAHDKTAFFAVTRKCDAISAPSYTVSCNQLTSGTLMLTPPSVASDFTFSVTVE